MRLLPALILLALGCTNAHAEGTLSLHVLDHSRHGSEVSLLLAIDDEAAQDPAEAGAYGDLPPPQACVDGGAMQDANQMRGGCFAIGVREQGRDIPQHRSRILFSGVAHSYVQLVYDSPSADAASSELMISIEHFGFRNYNADQPHVIDWSRGTLDARHPLRRAWKDLDDRLNADYRQLIGMLGARDDEIAAVRADERIWLHVTDANCGAKPPAYPEWEEDYLRCRMRFIERRLAELDHLSDRLGVPVHTPE